VPKEEFIWLRNAGNIITGPMSSTMRSLALACAVKGGKEIAIIGHTDCQVGKTTTMQLLESFRQLGVERHLLPDNLNEFFGVFGSERQNVIKAADVARSSPLLGPKIPVHGLLVDVQTGRVEWLVNGYQVMETTSGRLAEGAKSAEHTLDSLKSLTDFKIGDMKFPDTKIGEAIAKAEDWVEQKVQAAAVKVPPSVTAAAAKLVPQPPRIPLPRPIKPRLTFHKGKPGPAP
jgi:carbonic anhydrase